jgi:hypothetical protein
MHLDKTDLGWKNHFRTMFDTSLVTISLILSFLERGLVVMS